MRDRYWWAPLLGVLFIVLAVVAGILGGEPPDIDEGVQETLDYYTEDKDSLFAASIVEGLGAVVFIFFGAVLRSRFREVEGRGTLSAVVFGGTILFAAALALDATINVAAVEAADEVGESVDPVTVHTLAVLWQNDWIPLAAGVLTFLLGVGLSIVRFGIVGKWIGWVALLFAVLVFTPIFFVAFFGAAALILVLSVLLALRDRNAPPATGTPSTGGTPPTTPTV